MDAPRTPEESVFHAHLAAARYRSGAAAGRWRLESIAWPHTVFSVCAADGEWYGLRFDLTGYPRTPPTAQPWDPAGQRPLPDKDWPAGQTRVPLAFNPGWKDGRCLYLPCDRISLEGHATWLQEHPSLVWRPDIGVAHYLRVVSDLLNSGDYGGRRVA